MRYYVECTLEKGEGGQVVWIGEKYAIKGEEVKVKAFNYWRWEWSKGWVVTAVGKRRSEEELTRGFIECREVRRDR